MATTGCYSGKTYQAVSHDYEDPFDTTDKPIERQEKKTYEFNGVYFDNTFDGARLNAVTRENDTTFRITISAENYPINPSPWYAFRIWSEDPGRYSLILDYGKYRHRYSPKTSSDGNDWELLPEAYWNYSTDSASIIMQISLNSDTLWVAGQELRNSHHVKQWCELQARQEDVTLHQVGKSREGKPLLMLDIHQGASKKKDAIVIFSRQHPPEVTGYLAMQQFVETLLGENELANTFRQRYRILVYPLLNPDGVDMGHWRHNTGGGDLNRDWAYYRQAEVSQIANHVVTLTHRDKNRVILGLDFHSTYEDVYYTNENTQPVISGFKDQWLDSLRQYPEMFVVDEKPSEIKRPVSKSWFYQQFKADGITYEIGDDTPRAIIAQKGKQSAEALMRILLTH